MNTNSPKVNENFKIEVKLTKGVDPNQLFYIVVNRNGIVAEKRVTPEIVDGTTDINIIATTEMTPTCKVIIYYFQPTGEIVYDQVKVDVSTQSLNNVSAGIIFKLSVRALVIISLTFSDLFGRYNSVFERLN